mgnify:CR=1 FL=1
MPLVGEFHGKFWRARPTAPPPSGVSGEWMYPRVQAALILSSAIWWLPWTVLTPLWVLLCWYGSVLRQLWRWQCWARAHRLALAPAHFGTLDAEQLLILSRVLSALHSPAWTNTQQLVRATATTLNFNEPAAWVDYNRAIKANAGQAQNVFRHLKVVHALRATTSLSNPEAHLLAELAYQGFAAIGRPDREVVTRTVLH